MTYLTQLRNLAEKLETLLRRNELELPIKEERPKPSMHVPKSTIQG